MMKSAALAAICPVVALFGAAALTRNGQVAARQRSEWITFNPVTRLTAESFANPPAGDRPWVRMNMPATADPTEIATEIRELPDHGIAGVEVGQGAFPNNEQLVALFRAANQVGIQVSLSHGPTPSPAGYSIDDDHARKTLVVGKAVVNAGETFDGPVPPPTLTAAGRSGFGGLPQGGRGPGAAPGGRTAGGGRAAEGPPAGGRGGARGRGAQPGRATLIAALAYRCTQSPCAQTGPAELDRSSMIDLAPAVSGRNTSGVLGGTSAGDIRWTAPTALNGSSSPSGPGASSPSLIPSATKGTRNSSTAWRPD